MIGRVELPLNQKTIEQREAEMDAEQLTSRREHQRGLMQLSATLSLKLPKVDASLIESLCVLVSDGWNFSNIVGHAEGPQDAADKAINGAMSLVVAATMRLAKLEQREAEAILREIVPAVTEYNANSTKVDLMKKMRSGPLGDILALLSEGPMRGKAPLLALPGGKSDKDKPN